MTPTGLVRGFFGGVLMGLANLVPGISGGTMLVATGIYTRFIDAISDVTRLRLRGPSIVLLGIVILGAAVGIGGFAGIIASALAEHRWAMYSLFIGLTWGGAPLLVRMIRKCSASNRATEPPAVMGFLAGVVVMAGLAILQMREGGGSSGSGGVVLLTLGGVAGASAMILPGVSGAYLLLLLGQYDTIINAIKDTISALKDMDVQGVTDQMAVVIPVGIGVVLGIVGVANILRFLLHRYERATLGVLLGLLVAAPAGLYPFREGVPPVIGDIYEGEALTTQAEVDEIEPKDWPQRTFTPTPVQIAGALGLVILGLGITLGIDRLGRERTKSVTEPA